MLDRSLQQFLDDLASKAPTPGGGSVAALVGAQAAGLVAMCCHLTIGKPRYADHEAELRGVLAEADRRRAELCDLVAADVAAYEALSAAYRLPKASTAEAEAREAAIQEALVAATDTPLRIAEAAAAVADLTPTIVAKGSPVAVSDAGMAALLAAAALRSAALNVLINLRATTDPARVTAARRRLDSALSTRLTRADSLYHEVVARIDGS